MGDPRAATDLGGFDPSHRTRYGATRRRERPEEFFAVVRVLVEGRPGVGKTTIARRVAELVNARGFVTGELREGRRRVGFAVETLEGERAILAHVDLPGPPRVGKYGVDLAAFERLVLPVLERVRNGDVVVVDEIGKMELASDRFVAAFERLLERPVTLVATVHVFRHPFTDRLTRRPDVEVVQVTTANRDRLPGELAARLA